MEFEGFKQCMEYLLGSGILITTLISDRHKSIASHMKKVLKNITHYFDLWHLKKSKLLNYYDFSENDYSWNDWFIYMHPYYMVSACLQAYHIELINQWHKIKRNIFSISLFIEIRKVLTKISKEKRFEAVKEWIKPCERHLYWSATSTSNGNGAVIWAKFQSFLSHIVNVHEGLDNPLFNKCKHGELQPRRWLFKGMLCSILT